MFDSTSHNPPSPKRRKISRGAPTMKSSKSNQGNYSYPFYTLCRLGLILNRAVLQLTWPNNCLPVEIYDAIVQYLPRSDVQTMRLVNKEFDSKICQALFKVVVVPFRPEIYGITSDGESPQSAVMLQDKGMRVFQG